MANSTHRHEQPTRSYCTVLAEQNLTIPEELEEIAIVPIKRFYTSPTVLSDLPTMEQSISAGLPGKHIEMERLLAVLKRQRDIFYLQDYLKSTKYSAYEKVEKMLTEYVSRPWYTPDTSELKRHLQAVSADVRFELLKKQYGWGTTALHKSAGRGHIEVMRCLLQLVEPENQIQLLDIPNEYNKTALDVAEGEETVELIRQYRESAVREIAEGKSPRDLLSYVLNDLSLEERQSLMSDERLRSKTFLVNWPHDGNLSGVKMAQAGFYCVDDYDTVQCTFCHRFLHNWEVEDNPMTDHIKLFPSCPFVKGFELGIKEYKNENNTGELELAMLRIAELEAELAAKRKVVSLERVEVAPTTSDGTHNKDIAGTHKSLVNDGDEPEHNSSSHSADGDEPEPESTADKESLKLTNITKNIDMTVEEKRQNIGMGYDTTDVLHGVQPVAKSGRNGNRLKTDVISKTRHNAGCRECKGKRRTGNYPFKKCSHPKEFQHVTKQLKRIRTNQKAMREELISEYRASRCSTQDHPPTVPADLLSDAQQQEPVAPGTPAPPPVVTIEQPPPSVPYIADEQPGPSSAATARSATDRPINPVPPTFVQPPNLPATVEAVQEVGAEMDIMDE